LRERVIDTNTCIPQFIIILKALGFKTEKHVQDIAASCVACIHSTTICVLTYEELATRGWAPFSFSSDFDLASANTRTGIVAMAFTNSYMVRYLFVASPHPV
jgi:hypothetical protein